MWDRTLTVAALVGFCLIIVVSQLLVRQTVVAQTPPQIDSYQVRYYAPGAQAPLQQSDAFPSTSVQCNQVPPTILVTVNPTRLVWDDPAVPGRVCVMGLSGGSALVSFPVGNYEGTLAAINSAGSSPESGRAAFSRAATLSAPANFHLVR